MTQPWARADGRIGAILTDEQDPVAVGKILPKITELLTRDEQVAYIAVQKKMVMNLSPDAVVLTNRRFIVVSRNCSA